MNVKLTNIHPRGFLPCPFCGSTHVRVLPQEYGKSVDCETCGALKRVHSRLLVQARVEWNMRPRAKPVSQYREPK